MHAPNMIVYSVLHMECPHAPDMVYIHIHMPAAKVLHFIYQRQWFRKHVWTFIDGI